MKIDRRALARFAALRLHAPGAATSLQQGDRRSPFLGRGVEFADYRNYDPGDDIRLIDWNVYLRLGQVLVRQFNEERSLSVQLCVDVSASMGVGDPSKADRAAQLAASLATVALAHRDPVSLCCHGGDRAPARARAVNLDGMPEVLHVLQKVEPGGRGNAYAQIAGQLGTARRDRMFLLSDMLVEEDERESLLRLMAASSRAPVLVHILDPDELQPDLSDVSSVVDAETGEELTIKDGPSALAAYERGVQEWLAAIEERCNTLGVRYVRWVDTDPDGFVHDDLRARRVVEHAAGGNH